MLRTVCIETRSGSTYLIGPAADRSKIRVARVGTQAVRGTDGPVSFAWDADRVELVPSSNGLRLRIRSSDGQGFESTEIVGVTEHEIDELTAEDGEDSTVSV